MKLAGFPFGTIDWSEVEAVEHPGETGSAFWRTREVGGVRLRMVEYTPGYRADHWCDKGHLLLVVKGELTTELKEGRVVTLRAGTSYHVADGAEAHRSSTASGATLYIVD
jgi:quercetin dioxygenase-like cupin family protein